MNKLKKTTRFRSGEYIMVKDDRSVWSTFTILSPEMLLAIKNENIDYARAKEIDEAKKVAQDHNDTLSDNKITEIKQKWEKMKWKFEEGISFLSVDDALKQGIIQKVDNGYYMPTLDHNGMAIVNKLKKYAKKKN